MSKRLNIIGIVAALILCMSNLTYAVTPTTSFEQYKPNYFVVDWIEGRGNPWLLYSISFKFSLVRDEYTPRLLRFIPPGRVTLGFSQRAFWRIFDESAPFDEFNHNPELFYDGGRFKGGWEHVSTGVAGAGSRGWDRAFVEIEHSAGILTAYGRVWYVLQAATDNADIGDIWGFGDFGVTGTIVATSGQWYRHAVQFTRSSMLIEAGVRVGKNSNWYLFGRGFKGRGYSLVNYDKRIESASIGFALIR